MSRETNLRILVAEIVGKCNEICKVCAKVIDAKAALTDATPEELADELARRCKTKPESVAPAEPVRDATDFGWACRPRRVLGSFTDDFKLPDGPARRRRTTVPGATGRRKPSVINACGKRTRASKDACRYDVRKAMSRLRMGTRRFAEAMHVTETGVNHWLTGRSRPMSWRVMAIRQAARTGKLKIAASAEAFRVKKVMA